MVDPLRIRNEVACGWFRFVQVGPFQAGAVVCVGEELGSFSGKFCDDRVGHAGASGLALDG